MKMSSKFY